MSDSFLYFRYHGFSLDLRMIFFLYSRGVHFSCSRKSFVKWLSGNMEAIKTFVKENGFDYGYYAEGAGRIILMR